LAQKGKSAGLMYNGDKGSGCLGTTLWQRRALLDRVYGICGQPFLKIFTFMVPCIIIHKTE
jgi:hypothetical protein